MLDEESVELRVGRHAGTMRLFHLTQYTLLCLFTLLVAFFDCLKVIYYDFNESKIDVFTAYISQYSSSSSIHSFNSFVHNNSNN